MPGKPYFALKNALLFGDVFNIFKLIYLTLFTDITNFVLALNSSAESIALNLEDLTTDCIPETQGMVPLQCHEVDSRGTYLQQFTRCAGCTSKQVHCVFPQFLWILIILSVA